MIGRYIASRRAALNLSVNALARRAGLSHTYIANIERGAVQQPSIRVISALATALGITMGELLTAAGLESVANLALATPIGGPEREGTDQNNARSSDANDPEQDPRLYGVNAAWVDLHDVDREIIYNTAILLRELRIHLRTVTVQQEQELTPVSTFADTPDKSIVKSPADTLGTDILGDEGAVSSGKTPEEP